MLIKRFFVLIFFSGETAPSDKHLWSCRGGCIPVPLPPLLAQNKCIHPGVLLLAVALCLGAASRHEALESSFNMLGGV